LMRSRAPPPLTASSHTRAPHGCSPRVTSRRNWHERRPPLLTVRREAQHTPPLPPSSHKLLSISPPHLTSHLVSPLISSLTSPSLLRSHLISGEGGIQTLTQAASRKRSELMIQAHQQHAPTTLHTPLHTPLPTPIHIRPCTYAPAHTQHNHSHRHSTSQTQQHVRVVIHTSDHSSLHTFTPPLTGAAQ
jgi:hypothetical protein